MDKNEYKIKSDEIKALIAQGEYQQAAEIADSIDWRRVKSVMMLCTISDLYKINRRYEDSRDILLLAYDRHPGGRTIVYSLCELSIKIEDYVMAIEYYKEFVQIAPKDTGRYILQYKLYQAQDVSLEERIAVLEELKAKDYREKWAYELAYLYHRVGLATKCIEECDELILWFGEGKYVVKAMELKMLHQPLSDEQQGKYDSRFQPQPVYGDGEAYYEDGGPVCEDAEGQQYDPENTYVAETEEQGLAEEARSAVQPVDVLHAPTIRIPSEEIEIQVKTMDVGKYNTINLQKELAEGLREVLEEEETQDADGFTEPVTEMSGAGSPRTEAADGAGRSRAGMADDAMDETEQVETEVFFGATGEMGDISLSETAPESEEILTGEEVYTEEIPALRTKSGEEELPGTEDTPSGEAGREKEDMTSQDEMPAEPVDQTAALVMEQLRQQNLGIEPPKEMAEVLSMESDGQISMVVPESEKVEKQITGQMRIEDILAEWERMKRNNEERRREALHQKVLRQTGPMFTAFEKSIRDGLLEKLEQGAEPEDILAEAERFSGKEAVEAVTEENAGSAGEKPRGKAESYKEKADAEEPVEALYEDFPDEEGKYYGDRVSAQGAGTGEYGVRAAEREAAEEFFEEEPAEGYFEEESAGEEAVEEFFEEESPGEEAVEEFFEEESPDGEAAEAFYGEESPDGEAAEAFYGEESLGGEAAEAFYGEESPGGEAAEAFYGEESAGEESGEVFYEEESPEEFRRGERKGPKPVETASYRKKPADKKPVKQPQGAPASEETASADNSGEARPSGEKPRLRALTREEKELFGSFIQSKSSREKLIGAIDSISMASYTGNVVITGDEGMDTLTLAKNMIREVRMTDSNFSGKTAKISGKSLNQRDIVKTLDGLANGALIIQKASHMNKDTVDALYKALQQEKYGLIVIIEDTRKAMNKFLGVYTRLAECFNARMDMEALSNDALVAFGKKYARDKEYSIDELGILALHTRIAEQQTSNHAVTILDVKGIMDEAIRHANRKSMGHFVDILLAKRYDEEDMIILRENDFIY